MVSSNASNLPAAISLAIPLIKKWEGFKRSLGNGLVTAYLDPVGIPTIGWGTISYQNGQRVKMGDTITYDQAEKELQFDVKNEANKMIAAITKPLNSYQLAAIISMAYNAGSSNVSKTKFLAKVNNGDTYQAGVIIKDTIITAKGQRLQGLINRRKDESDLFNTVVAGTENTSLVKKKELS